MKKLLAALLFATTTSPALAEDTVTYRFKGLVEYGATPGTLPSFPPQSGSITSIIVTLDKSAVATTTANTAVYQGGVGCPGNPDPIISISVTIGTTSDPYVKPGFCDTVTIQQNVNGVYSIRIENNNYQTGSTFTAVFSATSPSAVTSLALPEKIETSSFDRSTFTISDGGEDVLSGDMVNRTPQ